VTPLAVADVLPLLGAPLGWPPFLLAGLLLLITPGFHLVASPLLEQRRVRWASDYPAVLVGDPCLAVAAGLGRAVSGAPTAWMARPVPGTVLVAAAVAFGAWQRRSELAAGRYSPAQAVSPTKLFHQFVVYPVCGYLVVASTAGGISHLQSHPLAGGAMIVCLALWAVLAVDALRRPRTGHGGFDWATRSAVPVESPARPQL